MGETITKKIEGLGEKKQQDSVFLKRKTGRRDERCKILHFPRLNTYYSAGETIPTVYNSIVAHAYNS